MTEPDLKIGDRVRDEEGRLGVVVRVLDVFTGVRSAHVRLEAGVLAYLPSQLQRL